MSEEPETTNTPESPETGTTPKPCGALRHKPECACRMCEAIRRNCAVAAQRIAENPKYKPRRKAVELRRRRFLQEFTDAKGPAYKNATRAALLAGVPTQSAATTGQQLLNEPQTQTRIIRALERQGITEDLLGQKLKEGLDAVEVQRATFEGEFTDERSSPDFYARHKYLETAHRLRGDFPREETTAQAALILKVPDRALAPGAWNDALDAGTLLEARRDAGGTPPRK